MSKWILCVLVSSGIGSLLYGIWYGMSRWLDGKKYVAAIYHSLHVVTVFFSLFAFCGIAVSLILEKIPTGTFWGYHNATVEMVAGVLCIIWMAGAVWNLARYVYFHRLHSKMVRGLEWCDREIQTVSAQVAEEMGLRNVPHMRTGHVLFTAELSGWRRPWVLLPDYDYTREQLEGIVAHELTHFVHGDRWVRELAVVTHCVHWFNPLVQALHRSLENWDELYCDSCVCSYDFISQREYAGTLLYMSEQFVEKKKSILDVAFSERGTHMIERIRCILDQTGERAKRSTTITITSLFVLMGILAATVAGCATYETYDELAAGSISSVPEEDQPQVSWKEEKEMIGTDGLSEFVGGYVEQIAGSSSSFECTLKNGRWASGGFQAWEGQNIAVALFSEKNVSLRVGILDPTGWLHYVSGSGDIAHTFQVEETGKYHLVIYSETSDSTEVSGIYFTRGEAGGEKAEDIKEVKLFPYRNGQYQTEIPAEEAQEIIREIGAKVDALEIYGEKFKEEIPSEEEWDEYRFAHYVTVQEQGDAFVVTAHVITAFDGLWERVLMVWLEDEPGDWSDYTIYQNKSYGAHVNVYYPDYSVGDATLGPEILISADYYIRITAPRDSETELYMKRFGFSLTTEQFSYNYAATEKMDCSVYDSVFNSSEGKKALLKTVWEQLPEDQREATKDIWQEGTVQIINLFKVYQVYGLKSWFDGKEEYWEYIAKPEDQISEYQLYQLEEKYHDLYYEQDIYLVSFPREDVVVTEVAVLVEPENGTIIGRYDWRGEISDP